MIFMYIIVCYQEVDLPIEFPHQLRQYIPNMYWNQHVNVMKTSMRVVALVSLREIENEELFSTYMDLIE
jgi:hypothetical protein